MTSPARIRANRKNAKKSTGPKTPQGKQAARRNAVKHGLTGQGVVVPDDLAPELDRERADWYAAYPDGGDPVARIHLDRAALAAVRLRRCAREEQARLDERRRHAVDRFDEQRVRAVEFLAEEIDDEPMTAAVQLRQMPEGCTWLITRWCRLGAALRERGHWQAHELNEAVHLLGLAVDMNRRTRRSCKIAWLHSRCGGPMPDVATSLAAPRRLPCVVRQARYPNDPTVYDWPGAPPIDPANAGPPLPPEDPNADPAGDARRSLLRMIRRELEGLRRDREAGLARLARDRAEAVDRCLFDDRPEAARMRRYESAAAADLHKAIAYLTRRPVTSRSAASSPAAAEPVVSPEVVAVQPSCEPAQNEPNGPLGGVDPPPRRGRSRRVGSVVAGLMALGMALAACQTTAEDGGRAERTPVPVPVPVSVSVVLPIRVRGIEFRPPARLQPTSARMGVPVERAKGRSWRGSSRGVSGETPRAV